MSNTSVDFQTYINAERERLTNLRSEAATRKEEAEAAIKEIDRELTAIAAYEKVKRGAAGGRKGKRSTGRRQELLNLIAQQPNITRRDILERLHARGDKTAEGSISNALSALKMAGKITLTDGKYTIA